MHYVDHYVIDWNKVQTLDDVKRLFAAMNVTFEPDYERLGSVIDLVRKERKPGTVAVMD